VDSFGRRSTWTTAKRDTPSWADGQPNGSRYLAFAVIAPGPRNEPMATPVLSFVTAAVRWGTSWAKSGKTIFDRWWPGIECGWWHLGLALGRRVGVDRRVGICRVLHRVVRRHVEQRSLGDVLL
jgi:hypothetical protein